MEMVRTGRIDDSETTTCLMLAGLSLGRVH